MPLSPLILSHWHHNFESNVDILDNSLSPAVEISSGDIRFSQLIPSSKKNTLPNNKMDVQIQDPLPQSLLKVLVEWMFL